METHNTEPPDPAVDAGASPSSDAEPVSALAVLHESGVILHQDYYLAEALGRAFPGISALCRLSCALASNALAEGHICLDLASMAGQKISAEPGAAPLVRLPGLQAWTRELAESACVAESGKGGKSRVLRHPLVLDRDNFLYLAKYYDFQERLIHNISGRVSGNSGTGIASNFIDKGLEEQFAGQDPERTAGQRRAVKKALESRFLVISGGPGTGKTFVTAIIRSLLENWHREQGLPSPVILSLAPTGKAAERMDSGRTIHSVLRPSPNGVGFLHGADNPLRADLVIVDEASMIDMALMTRLVEAVPKTARLILLGDKDQLSPVQAGAVFTDLCAVRGLEASRAFLSVNFRSAGKSGIDTLARAVNENDPRAVADVLQGGAYPDVAFIDTGNNALGMGIIETHLRKGYRDVAESRTPEEALGRMDRFRVLCAHTRGPAGTLQVNHLCQKILRSEGPDGITTPFFRQIVMVTRNDYGRGLFNGDTGVVFETESRPRAWFRDKGKGYPLSQIPAHEAAYAVTIHKAQGSEFDTVLILIPDRLSPVVTRQLLYTGITRARSKVIIAGRPDLIAQAVALSPERRSNLPAGLERILGTLPETENQNPD